VPDAELSERNVTEELRALVALSAAVAWRDPAKLASAIDGAAGVADTLAVEEALVQAHLFVGFPAALHALALWRERTRRAPPPPLPEPHEVRRKRGEQVCRVVYGTAYERLVENIGSLHPDLANWMIEDGYGKVLGRPGLDLRSRELCIVGLLAAQPSPGQLHSHLRGALRAGASTEDVEQALAAVAEVVPHDRAAAAYAVWQRVQERGQ
jgi:4-carboxymuconolactone decarboxylase